MSISSEITRISDNISDAYTAANAKGATMPVSQNSDNLASTIATIQTGVTPTGTISITSNGTHDVTNYATADVNVPTVAPEHYLSLKVSNNNLTGAEYHLNLTGIKDAGTYLSYLFYNKIATIDSPDLSTITSGDLSFMFNGNTGLTGNIVFGKIGLNKTIKMNGAFQGTNISSVVVPGDSGGRIAYESQCFYNAFASCPQLTSVTFQNKVVSGTPSNFMDNMFYNDTNLTTITNLSGFLGTNAQIYGMSQTFSGCSSLQELDLSACSSTFAYGGSNMCRNCTSLTYVNLSNLVILGNQSPLGSAFMGCTALKKQKFESLTTVQGTWATAYGLCNQLHIYFYALTTPGLASYWSNIFGTSSSQNATDCVLHFPIKLAQTMSSYVFGGTNTTALFDIVTSLTGADTNTYTRQEKDSTSTATAWVNNNTLYYTSGTTEPVVGDTIYSDAACTTVVTTIDSIA